VAEVANEGEGDVKKFSRYTYPTMQKVQGSFTLDIEAGEFTDSEILVRARRRPRPSTAPAALPHLPVADLDRSHRPRSEGAARSCAQRPVS